MSVGTPSRAESEARFLPSGSTNSKPCTRRKRPFFCDFFLLTIAYLLNWFVIYWFLPQLVPQSSCLLLPLYLCALLNERVNIPFTNPCRSANLHPLQSALPKHPSNRRLTEAQYLGNLGNLQQSLHLFLLPGQGGLKLTTFDHSHRDQFKSVLRLGQYMSVTIILEGGSWTIVTIVEGR